ncbi:MAG: argininosuccinate lyase [Deltaproteobacteria bacterium]|nr:argininosuccinate lyase [Deltaproteobacteria bacterium]MBI4795320.1 argininosuccinate lyase [Deltaproteobacteria bacterium]
MAKKPWGGRFQGGTEQEVEAFTSSLDFDRRLYRQDIAGSQAHARMLARQGIIAHAEAEAIVRGLEEIRMEMEAGEFSWDPALEDVHMAVEARLIEKIGEVGRKLHTARSRNDQVALDVRLYLAEEVEGLLADLAELRRAGAQLARRHLGVLLPGYTHLQRAQPVLFSHHLLAYDEMWRRDQARLTESLARIRVSPLGAAALAGTTFPIDPQFSAAQVGFPEVFRNSLDAVSDRDFLLEFFAFSSIMMVHLSRLAEELVLWSGSEFGFVELPDAYATGSSIMPQKKNPDVPELVRGKCGRVCGHLLGLLMTLKGLPLAYNRDLQEDKEPLFDTLDTVKGAVRLMAGLLGNLKIRPERMAAALYGGFLTATDMADYLAAKGVPFRTAHEQVGQTVRYAETQKKELWELSLEEIRPFAPQADTDLFDWLKIENSVARRTSAGGTAPVRVAEALKEVEKELGLE